MQECGQGESRIEEGKIKVQIPEGAKRFECPICGKKLKVPRCFTECPCGEWIRVLSKKIQPLGWGRGEDIEEAYMILQQEKTAEKMTEEAARSIFMGMFTEIHHQRIGMQGSGKRNDGGR